MKFSPQRALIAAALATAFVGLSATAIAQGKGPMSGDNHAQHMGQGGPGMQQGMGKRMEDMQKRHAEHQAKLKADLKVTAAQEAAWTAFVAGTAHTPRGPHAGMADDWAKLTTPQRLDKMQAQRAERSAEMDKHVAAVKTFYAALSAEQQKVFDTQRHGFERAGMRGGKHGGHHGGHHGQGGMGGMGGEGMMMKPRS
jgi:protein CpxP